MAGGQKKAGKARRHGNGSSVQPESEGKGSWMRGGLRLAAILAACLNAAGFAVLYVMVVRSPVWWNILLVHSGSNLAW